MDVNSAGEVRVDEGRLADGELLGNQYSDIACGPACSGGEIEPPSKSVRVIQNIQINVMTIGLQTLQRRQMEHALLRRTTQNSTRRVIPIVMSFKSSLCGSLSVTTPVT